jgi:hypothetical protein
MKLKNNRRKLARYGIGSLRARLFRTRLLGLISDQVDVTPIDFSTAGLGFRHSQLLVIGQPVVFELTKDQYTVKSVVGIVRHTARMKNHYRYGVEFDFEANEHMRSPQTKDTLKLIEKLLHEVVIITVK